MDLTERARECKQNWQQFYQTVTKPRCCIYCEGKAVSWRGSRTRKASVKVDVDYGAEVVYLHDILCRRVKCGTAGCGRSWTLRPPGLFPRRHYQLCVVASATSQYLHGERASQEAVATAHSCSRRSLGRWLSWEAKIAKPADLQRHLLNVSEVPVVAPERPVANLVLKAATTIRQRMLTTAAAVLGLFEALGAALGYEPPGLRRVLEVVVGNRDRVTTLAAPAVPELARRHLSWPVAVCAL